MNSATGLIFHIRTVLLELKGAQAWDIRDRFFTQIRPVRVGDLGTGEKNEIVLILRFSLWKSYEAYDQHALNNQKNFKLAQQKNLWDLY